MISLHEVFESATDDALIEASLSHQAKTMTSSRILEIAYAVKAAIARGEQVANFTVGDFAPSQFQIPTLLKESIVKAVQSNQTNYPPANGTPELRLAIQQHYERRLGLSFPLESFVVASGARPVLYATYQCLIDPGETVVSPAPSWNNTNFCQLVGANHVTVPTCPEEGFMPTAESLAPVIGDARLLVLCSPMNPAGTLISDTQLKDICTLVVDENRRRIAAGKRRLFMIYDQVYWMLAFGDNRHLTPQGVCPEIAPYCILTDAVSKSFAGTGLRVGWAAAPPFLADKIKSLMTHMGAWAPKPEQVGTTALLNDFEAVDTFMTAFKEKVQARLQALYDGFTAMKNAGLPVDTIRPQGAIYLSAYIDYTQLKGIADEEALVQLLLKEAGCAVVPFSAFGDEVNTGWFRFSVGAVTDAEITDVLPRVKRVLETRGR
jgi:aspartate aminotransferase